MGHLVKLFALLAVLQFSAPASFAASSVSPEKRALILQLLTDTGFHEAKQRQAQAFAAQYVGKLRKNDKELSERASAILREEVMIELRYAEQELIEASIKAYDRHFSLAELQHYAAFYASPLGKKWFRAMPEIMVEDAAASRALTNRLTPTIMARIKNRFRAGDLE